MENNLLEKIVEPLLDWYHKNSRCLPWRENREAYRVWVSEIMLQQTRVETVIPYYERFMKRFPTIASLAACEDEELFKLWEGLGYYSRARNLKKAAQVICAQHQGNFPEEFEEILALPGIGAYTAGAISSIAFEKAKAAVDGNVLRVITRLTQDSHDILDAKFRGQVTEELERIYPSEGRGDFTQSLMELGAVVCVPNGEPRCGECPLNSLCRAYGSGTQLQYPVKKKKIPRKVEQKTVLILQFQGKTALRKRDDKGILSGMWELPNIDGTLDEQRVRQWLAEKALAVKEVKTPVNSKKQLKHVFTHIEWHMTYWIVICENEGNDDEITWVTATQLENEIALPTAFKKVYRSACIT
ncbi:MAG: A/G-specific adenine glycosylase [Lachnospiraceae bacterium]|nr:A/G-specific adenine glycosylase [Lachnospiraceae bacterium]